MTSIERSTVTVRRNGRSGNGLAPGEDAPLVVSPAGALARLGRGDGPDGVLGVRPSAPEPPVHVATRPQSSYLQYLPGVYLKNEFLGRFLLIFESIMDPIDRQVGQVHSYFDPDTAPREVLKWLGSWFGLVIDDRLPEDRRRTLVESAAELFAWRGTKRGMALLLRLTLGVEPEIVEPTLAVVTQDPAANAWRFTIRLTVPESEPFDNDAIHQLIDQNRPAASAATVEITRTK